MTENGLTKLSEAISKDILAKYELIQVSDQVMSAMADSESPQGIIALCSTKSLKLKDLWQRKPSKIAFFWQIQGPVFTIRYLDFPMFYRSIRRRYPRQTVPEIESGDCDTMNFAHSDHTHHLCGK